MHRGHPEHRGRRRDRTCTIANAPAGNYTAQASQAADSNYGASTSNLDAATVNTVTPTNAVADNTVSSPSLRAAPSIFTDTITGVDGIAPTGAVTWTITGPGSTSCTAGTPSIAGDVVTMTCTIANAPAGSYTAQASQAADSNYGASTSNLDAATVNTVTPTNAVADNTVSSPSLRAAPRSSPTPSPASTASPRRGAVTWTITGPGHLVHRGTPSIAGDVETITCTIANAPAGSYTAQASQAADSNYATSTSNLDAATVSTVTPTNAVSDNTVAPRSHGRHLDLHRHHHRR